MLSHHWSIQYFTMISLEPASDIYHIILVSSKHIIALFKYILYSFYSNTFFIRNVDFVKFLFQFSSESLLLQAKPCIGMKKETKDRRFPRFFCYTLTLICEGPWLLLTPCIFLPLSSACPGVHTRRHTQSNSSQDNLLSLGLRPALRNFNME